VLPGGVAGLGLWLLKAEHGMPLSRQPPQGMQAEDLLHLLDRLISNWESEVVEFKRAGDGFSTADIGKYFSALANEANLRGAERAWLVFGVDNRSRSVCGTDYRLESDRLQGMKLQIAQGTAPSVSFRDIHVVHHPAGRVLMFEIPPAPLGIPIAWQGHYYARAGESLVPLGLDKQDEIRAQTAQTDWSAQVVAGASLDDLDPEAVDQARRAFSDKHANRFRPEDIANWPRETLLDRARLTRHGQVTRAALLLLGKPEAAHMLLPHPAQLTWRLEGPERAYEHFGPPFLLATTQLYRKIRNIQLRVLPDDSLLPIEVAKYDQKILLEALHNCIAHQDYSRYARVVVTEQPDRLVFESEGGFFEGEPGDYVRGTVTPRRYRNPFLAQAMAELNMIDTMGYGIHAMFEGQARRFFPLPDYDLSEPGLVRLTVHGRVIDPAYTRILIQNTTLPIEDVLALDRVQKRIALDEATVQRLRRAGLVEGRRPNLHVSAVVAQATADKANYILNRGQDDAFYERLVLDLLARFGSASRREIDELLLEKLADRFDDEQKLNKVSLLLTRLRRAGRIRNAGTRKVPRWVIGDTDAG
jgi:ATP-dependent DNA helicase RecG